MKTMLRFLAVVIAAAALVVIVRSRQISNARSELARLETNNAIESSRALSRSPASTATEGEITRLRAGNRDIYKLRGQITQARAKRKEIERMQAENAQLREKISEIKLHSGSISSFPLVNKGQATPEAALETAFWTMYQGDMDGLTRIMPMTAMDYQRMPPAERTNSVLMMRAMASSIAKLDILDQKLDSPGEAYLTIRITPREGTPANSPFASHQSTFALRRTNDIWQIVGERRER
jgi:cell division protein FtsB